MLCDKILQNICMCALKVEIFDKNKMFQLTCMKIQFVALQIFPYIKFH